MQKMEQPGFRHGACKQFPCRRSRALLFCIHTPSHYLACFISTTYCFCKQHNPSRDLHGIGKAKPSPPNTAHDPTLHSGKFGGGGGAGGGGKYVPPAMRAAARAEAAAAAAAAAGGGGRTSPTQADEG